MFNEMDEEYFGESTVYCATCNMPIKWSNDDCGGSFWSQTIGSWVHVEENSHEHMAIPMTD